MLTIGTVRLVPVYENTQALSRFMCGLTGLNVVQEQYQDQV